MISHGEGFILRHSSGRYLTTWLHIETDSAGCHVPGVPMVWTYGLVANALEAKLTGAEDHWPRWIGLDPSRAWIAEQFEVVPGPGCACCGERWNKMLTVGDEHRCDKHRDRNPCAIEGCRRTTAAEPRQLASDQYLCGEHWRRYVPARSMMRRHYHRYFRRAKREGWTDNLKRGFWRYWAFIVAQARRKATEGDLNIGEIERMFGL